MIYGDNVYSEIVQTAYILLFYRAYNTLTRSQIRCLWFIIRIFKSTKCLLAAPVDSTGERKY